MKPAHLPYDPNNLLDQGTRFLVAHGPRGLVPIFQSDERRVFVLIIAATVFVFLFRIAVAFTRMRGSDQGFWVEQFGRSETKIEDGTSKTRKTGAKLRWKRNRWLRRQVLTIRDVAHGIDEQYVLDRLDLIFQKTHLRFVDAKVVRGIVYLYRDRFDEPVSLESLPRAGRPFTATPGIDSQGAVIHLSMAEQNCLGGFGKPGSGKTILSEAINTSLRWVHKNASTLIASPKLEIDFSEALKNKNTTGVDTSSVDGKVQLLAELRKIQDRNDRLKAEFGRLGIRHLKDHPLLSQDVDHDIAILILDEIPSYTRKRKLEDKVEEEVVQQLTAIIESLILQGRAYGVMMVLLAQGATKDYSDLPLSQLHWVVSGATPTAEASRVLFGSDIAYDSALTAGRMILRRDGNFRIKVGR